MSQSGGKLILISVFVGAVLVVLCATGASVLLASKGGDARPVGVDVEPATDDGAEPAPAVATGAIARIQAAGKLKVYMDTGEPPWTGTPPMYFRNEKGRSDGFDQRVATVIARAIGVKETDIVHAKYSELADAFATTQSADLLISGYSPTEVAGVTWSVPYLDYGLCLVVPTTSSVQTVADLWGKSVGIFDDDAAAADVNRLVKGYKELVRVEDGYWDQLATGAFAGFIYDYPYAVAEINAFYKTNPHRAGAFRIAQFNLTDSTYAVGVHSADADLLKVVNEAITTWRESPDYTAAVKEYLSAGLAAPAAPKGAKKVVVKAGDTLSGIAERELGDRGKWKVVWELNKARFPNPHLIEVGDEVVLPG